jgi:hypothetical protein
MNPSTLSTPEFSLAGASKGDRVTNSVDQQGTIEYISEIYGIRFDNGSIDRYESDGCSETNPLPIVSWQKATTPQTLPIPATYSPTITDIDVNGNIQILTSRGWEVCSWAEYEKEQWAHTPLYLKDPKKLAGHIQCAIDGGAISRDVLQQLLIYLKLNTQVQ